MKPSVINEKIFFGAANGYSGFRTNFDRIFSPRKLDKLFIIKGGPGTGKSSLMRKVKEHFLSDADINTVLCSSDPESLDGLLITSDGITVGLVDGTAPHTMDPEYPGAVEEIINLGDSFNLERLQTEKEKIIDLSDRKKENYKRAYSSLKIAGYIYNNIYDIFSECACYNRAENDIVDFIGDEKNGESNIIKSDFLLGAFCKSGYKILNNHSETKQYVLIKGDGISEYMIMTKIKKMLMLNSIDFTYYTSAFSENLYDAIETSTTLYTITKGKEYSLDCTGFTPKNYEYEQLKTSYLRMLENAQLSLIKASEYHFKLEAIYSTAMSFEKNDQKCAMIIDKMRKIFHK